MDRNQISFKEKYLLFFKNTLKYWFVGIILSSFIQFFFMFVIIFHHTIAMPLSSIEYIMLVINVILASLLIYPCYIYSNKSFWCNNCIVIFQLCMICFVVPITLYFSAEITGQRINNTETHITLYLSKGKLMYTAFGLYFGFILSGASLLVSILGFYFSSKISSKPWKMRIENEKVISKPTN